MNFTDFWRFLKNTITPARLSIATDLVKAASDKFMSNKERRDWVVNELMKTPGISENIARLLVEMAVKYVKEEQ